MQRYVGLLAAAIVAVAVFLFSVGMHERHVTVIGIVQYTASSHKTLKGFQDGLAADGLVEGRTVTYLPSGAIDAYEGLQPAVKKLVRQKPDLIFVSTTPATQFVKKLTVGSGIPVVFAPVSDPVAAGIVEHLERPEANLTGVRLSPSEGRRLQELMELSPGGKRILVPHDTRDMSSRITLDALREAAPTLGLELVVKPLDRDTDLSAGSSYVPDGVDAIFLPRSGPVLSRTREFTDLAIPRGIPVSVPRLAKVQEGATMGYGFVGYEMGKQAARLAHLILTGTPVANLPVETSQDYLFVNMDTARKSGIAVPDAFLRRARYIIRSGK